jgi:probable blue pigment (indigoidine) exporter
MVPSMEARWRWVLLTAVAPVTWGSTYYVTREFLPADHPLWGSVLRALPAGLLLLAVTRLLPTGRWWWRSLVLGTLNLGAFFVLVYLAAQLLPSSLASTLMALSAAVMMLLAWPLLGERPTLLPLAGVVTGLVGVALMLLTGREQVDLVGVGASVVAMVSSSVGFILTKRWGSGVPVLALTSWQLVAAGLVLVPVALVVEGPFPTFTTQAWGAHAYLAVVGTAVAYAAWFTGLKHLPAGTVGLVGLLNPVVGVLLGTLVAREVLSVQQVVGIVLVLGGVLLGRAGARTPADRVDLTP